MTRRRSPGSWLIAGLGAPLLGALAVSVVEGAPARLPTQFGTTGLSYDAPSTGSTEVVDELQREVERLERVVAALAAILVDGGRAGDQDPTVAVRELTGEERAALRGMMQQFRQEQERSREKVLRAVEDMRRAEAERRVIERLPWWARLLLRRG